MSRHEHKHTHPKQQKFRSVECRGPFIFVLSTASVLLLSHFSHVRLCNPTDSRDSPGKNTGVGCHFLLQCMKGKRESEVAQSCPTLSDPMDCSLPGSSIHGIFQATVLEWGAIAFSDCYFMVKMVCKDKMSIIGYGRCMAVVRVKYLI